MISVSLGITIGTLVIALVALVKGADFLIDGARTIGFRLGISKFIVGVLIVGFGTSLPELASSIAAVLKGETGIVLATAVGSNISNILLIVGLLVFVGGTIHIKRDLIRSELPLFFIATAHFLAAVYDGVIDRIEGLLLLGTFGAYLWYIFSDKNIDTETSSNVDTWTKAIFFVLVGILAVTIGAHYTVSSAIELATLTGIPIAVVSIVAIALGTSLPELVVSLQSIKTGETEMAIGNIFGSNAFNLLFVVSLPALIAPLIADPVVMELGLMVLLVSSVIFFVNGLSQRIMRYEGLMFLLFFAFFIVKMFEYL